jgi:hypothetical protein
MNKMEETDETLLKLDELSHLEEIHGELYYALTKRKDKYYYDKIHGILRRIETITYSWKKDKYKGIRLECKYENNGSISEEDYENIDYIMDEVHRNIGIKREVHTYIEVNNMTA